MDIRIVKTRAAQRYGCQSSDPRNWRFTHAAAAYAVVIDGIPVAAIEKVTSDSQWHAYSTSSGRKVWSGKRAEVVAKVIERYRAGKLG